MKSELSHFAYKSQLTAHICRHLILANSRALQIFSTSTSLLERTLAAGSGSVSAFTLSSWNPNRMYCSTSGGLTTLWDYETGTKVARWNIGTHICGLATISPTDVSHDLVFVHEVQSHQHVINIHSLRSGSEASQSEVKQILKTKSRILSFQTVAEGAIIVVACKDSLFIGQKGKSPWTSLKSLQYTWWEIKIAQPITTMHAYLRSGFGVDAPLPTKQRKSTQEPKGTLDVAIGDEEGKIYVFEDIISKFSNLEHARQIVDQADNLTPRCLHWHRNSVGSIKWSRDGKL